LKSKIDNMFEEVGKNTCREVYDRYKDLFDANPTAHDDLLGGDFNPIANQTGTILTTVQEPHEKQVALCNSDGTEKTFNVSIRGANSDAMDAMAQQAVAMALVAKKQERETEDPASRKRKCKKMKNASTKLGCDGSYQYDHIQNSQANEEAEAHSAEKKKAKELLELVKTVANGIKCKTKQLCGQKSYTDIDAMTGDVLSTLLDMFIPNSKKKRIKVPEKKEFLKKTLPTLSPLMYDAKLVELGGKLVKLRSEFEAAFGQEDDSPDEGTVQDVEMEVFADNENGPESFVV